MKMDSPSGEHHNQIDYILVKNESGIKKHTLLLCVTVFLSGEE